MFVDYCLVPRFAIGAGYGLIPAKVTATGQNTSLFTLYGNFYLTGIYWSSFATFGVLSSFTGGSAFLPGLGIEYRTHKGLLFRAAIYALTNSQMPGWLNTPIGVIWPGVSLGLALWPGSPD